MCVGARVGFGVVGGCVGISVGKSVGVLVGLLVVDIRAIDGCEDPDTDPDIALVS